MVDEEVEHILREIRGRVRAQELPSAIADGRTDRGAVDSSLSSERAEVDASASEALARIDSYLTVTSRAWDRLPPVASNRTGGIAGLELWIKRLIKRVTHWFTWEQVNFNAAVHHALTDALHALSESERALAELKAEAEAQREITVRVIEAQRSEHSLALKELDAQRTELKQVMQGRLELMQDEQRVCFKQLSLEATEAAVLEDRARRKAETLLEELSRQVEKLEKKS